MLEELGARRAGRAEPRYDEDAVVAAVVAADPAIARLHERMAGVDPEATYYQRIELGERIRGRRGRPAGPPTPSELLAALEELAPMSASPTSSTRTWCSTPRSSSTGPRCRPSGAGAGGAAAPEMAVRYVGPLPPYSFADPELTG